VRAALDLARAASTLTNDWPEIAPEARHATSDLKSCNSCASPWGRQDDHAVAAVPGDERGVGAGPESAVTRRPACGEVTVRVYTAVNGVENRSTPSRKKRALLREEQRESLVGHDLRGVGSTCEKSG